MEEKIKEIVSVFIKVPAGQIGSGTPIGRSAVQSSILLHRMYARLREEGLAIDDYASIKVFGDLLAETGSGGEPVKVLHVPANGYGAAGSVAGVGIDIEELAALPRATDFRKETFYTENFTPGEISYCILQSDPYATFTGLFAAKEAIVKADARFRPRTFLSLEIGHAADGRPTHPSFDLSISHAGGMAVAVAISRTPVSQSHGTATIPTPAAARSGTGTWIGWIALLLAVAALLVALKR